MTMEVGELTANQKTPAPARWRRAYVATSVVVAMLVSGTVVLPFALINTPLRDLVLGSALNNEVLTATSERASGGWFAPLVFGNVRIADAEGRVVCTIRELRSSKGLLSCFTDASHAGIITFVEPRIEIHVGEDGNWPDCGQRPPSDAQLSYAIENGSFLLTVPWRQVPIVELNELQVTGRIGPDATGRRMLTVDATQILDHEPLSESHTQQNLALVAPVLSQSTQLSGSASVWIDELQIPLDGTKAAVSSIPIRGRAEFHSLEARLKEDWTRQLAVLTAQLTRTELPDRIEVLKDSRVDFVVTDNGVSHNSMLFLLPQVSEHLMIESSGVIHLDASLDLRLAVTMPAVATAGRPVPSLLAQMSNEPLLLQVRGTVSKPQLQLPEGTSLLGEISQRVAPAAYEAVPPSLPSAITGLLQDAGNSDKDQVRKDLPGNILNIIRAVDQAKKNSGEQRRRKSRQR